MQYTLPLHFVWRFFSLLLRRSTFRLANALLSLTEHHRSRTILNCLWVKRRREESKKLDWTKRKRTTWKWWRRKTEDVKQKHRSKRDDEFIDNSYIIHGQRRPSADIYCLYSFTVPHPHIDHRTSNTHSISFGKSQMRTTSYRLYRVSVLRRYSRHPRASISIFISCFRTFIRRVPVGPKTSCYQHQRRWIEHGQTNEKEKKREEVNYGGWVEGGPLCAWFALNVFALDSVWCSSDDFRLDIRFDTELWCQQRTTMADLVCHLLFIRPHLTATTSSNEVVFLLVFFLFVYQTTWIKHTDPSIYNYNTTKQTQ